MILSRRFYHEGNFDCLLGSLPKKGWYSLVMLPHD